jgi:hypothetical protein
VHDAVDRARLSEHARPDAAVADQGGLEQDAVRPLLEVVVDGLLAPAA